MLDYGFRRPLRGSNSGVRTKNTLSLARSLNDPTPSSTNLKNTRHGGLYWFGPSCGVIPYSSVVVDCLEGLRMN